MTNRIAIWLALLIVALLALDAWIYGSDHLLFLGRRFLALLDWLAFWR